MKWLVSNWILKVWALVLAIALSAYVNNLNNNVVEMIEAPLRITGLNDELVIASEVPAFVILQVSAPLSAIKRLRDNPPDCTLNLEAYSSTGIYEVGVIIPAMVEVDVIRMPPAVKVNLKEKTTKSLVIEEVRSGLLPPDFIEAGLRIVPQEVEVSGAEEDVDKIAHALITIQLEGVRSRINRIADVVLMDANNRELPMRLYTLSNKTVRYDLDVSSISNVKLLRVFPDIIGEPPENYLVGTIEVVPKYVSVPLEILEGSETYIYTAPIDLKGEMNSFKRMVDINYPFNAGEDMLSEASVTVEIVEVGTNKLQIEVIGEEPGTNVRVNPGYVVLISPELQLLTDEERAAIRAIISVSGFPPGEYRMQPQLVLDPKIKNPTVLPGEIAVEIVPGGEEE